MPNFPMEHYNTTIDELIADEHREEEDLRHWAKTAPRGDIAVEFHKGNNYETRSWPTIMDFLDEMKDMAKRDDRKTVKRWIFFGNLHNAGHDTTLGWLVRHCQEITR